MQLLKMSSFMPTDMENFLKHTNKWGKKLPRLDILIKFYKHIKVSKLERVAF